MSQLQLANNRPELQAFYDAISFTSIHASGSRLDLMGVPKELRELSDNIERYWSEKMESEAHNGQKYAVVGENDYKVEDGILVVEAIPYDFKTQVYVSDRKRRGQPTSNDYMSIGVAAVPHLSHSGELCYLFGRKKPDTRIISNVWELVPQGNIDRKVVDTESTFDKTMKLVFARELPEAEHYKSFTPRGILIDGRGAFFTLTGSLELSADDESARRKLLQPSDEHAELALVSEAELGTFLTENRLYINPVSLRILEDFSDERENPIVKNLYQG